MGTSRGTDESSNTCCSAHEHLTPPGRDARGEVSSPDPENENTERIEPFGVFAVSVGRGDAAIRSRTAR
jgi:hypothetical protein